MKKNPTLQDTFRFTTKLLPKKPAKQLRTTLENLMEKLANQVKMARELEAHNDETIDFVFKMKKPEMTQVAISVIIWTLLVIADRKEHLYPFGI